MKKLFFIIFLLFINHNLFAEEKILTSPLINLEKLKPSFEEIDESVEEPLDNEMIKNKKLPPTYNTTSAVLIGLDKITAKTIKIKIKLGETAKFGILEIKALKCGISNSEELSNNSAAYIQVRDISENRNEKVFIFNGWTFSSNPSIAPIDHAIYDIWLVGCENA